MFVIALGLIGSCDVHGFIRALLCHSWLAILELRLLVIGSFRVDNHRLYLLLVFI